LSPDYKRHPEPSTGVAFVIAAAAVGAVLGLVGGLYLKRRSQREPNDLLHHPERLDQMLDPTDDA
jgi:LPXTG-motif cell wall-anchored protein